MKIFIRLCGALAATLIYPVQAADKPASPVVVELFTSQNCAGCVPVDDLAGKIAHNPDSGLIVLACHVDYWDHLRWKDTLSLRACTERQRDYATQLIQGRSYTPNLILNGRVSLIDATGFERSVDIARRKQPVERIDIEMTQTGFVIHLPDLPKGQQVPYELNVLTYQTNRTVEITAGENRGKTITYAHAVSGITRIDPWLGHKETRTIEASSLPSDHLHGVVVIAQRVRGGPVRAAGEYRIYFK